jgi:hypothetical protein
VERAMFAILRGANRLATKWISMTIPPSSTWCS